MLKSFDVGMASSYDPNIEKPLGDDQIIPTNKNTTNSQLHKLVTTSMENDVRNDSLEDPGSQLKKVNMTLANSLSTPNKNVTGNDSKSLFNAEKSELETSNSTELFFSKNDSLKEKILSKKNDLKINLKDRIKEKAKDDLKDNIKNGIREKGDGMKQKVKEKLKNEIEESVREKVKDALKANNLIAGKTKDELVGDNTVEISDSDIKIEDGKLCFKSCIKKL